MQITHEEAMLRNIRPNQFAAYLRSRSWTRGEQIGTRATVWTAKSDGDREYEILLPLDATLNEYADGLSEALQTLAIAEQRSQLDIVRDIVRNSTLTTSDVLRIELVHSSIKNGTLPLNLGVAMVAAARDLILAAACAAACPRAVPAP